MGMKVVTVVPVVVLGGGGGGGAGYGAKWKHVTQGPLKRNPAQQKKGTHIIIKSSQGEAKTANIIPAPPTHPPNTHTLTHSSPSFPVADSEDRMIGATVCLLIAWEWQEDVWKLPDHDQRFVCFQGQTWSKSHR